MIINGKDITFRFNIRATKKIAELCPNRDLQQIDKLFDREDLTEFLDVIGQIAIAMSLNHDNKEPLTEEDIEEMDFSDLAELQSELLLQMRRDRGGHVETTAKKKAETASSSD